MKSHIEQIKEEVKKYKLDSLVERAIERIKFKPAVDQPWTLLSYLEIVYREADNNQFKFDATLIDFNRICELIFHLMDHHEFADLKKYGPEKMFQVLAYQQFSYQRKYSIEDINRIYFLFNADNENSRISTLFKEKYNVSINQYLKVWKSRIIDDRDLKLAEDVKAIFKLLTINHNDIPNCISDFYIGIHNDFYKTFAPEFFVRFPFLNYKNKLYCIDSRLLSKAFYNFIFTHVSENPEIKGEFDKRFQNYVEKTIQDAGLKYQKDTDLKTEGELECDFFISDFLFIECKAIKLRTIAQVYPEDEILKNNMKDILKAYKQIIATANRVQYIENPYGVIVTYSPFYFSDAAQIWKGPFQEEMETFVKNKSWELIIKPENLFFIDIKSWENLIKYLKDKNSISILEVFKRAKNKNDVNLNIFEFTRNIPE